jgi:hypothetical protein
MPRTTLTPRKPAPADAPRPIPCLDAHQLRELAEAASSLRRPGGEPFYGVVASDGVLRILPGTCEIPGRRLFEIDTYEVEQRPRPTSVKVECGGTESELADRYDALFWSEAAVEKFVLPYYASKSLWEAAAVLNKISFHWYGGVPKDTRGGFSGSTRRPGVLAEAEDEVPFAIGHTPDSDWSDLTDAHRSAPDLHLLFRRGDAVEARPLSRLPDPPAEWRPDPAARGRARQTRAARDGA